ncbi:MAG: ThiF family adenylyltransferase [Euryarchaeota archaeon]|nr:ThiF family adenylyltransferase [Euryarchaeota archaeon]
MALTVETKDRYSRQIVLEQIGKAGQERLRKGRAVIVGCGALGCAIANSLARAGVGELRVIDRDVVELNNLQRQQLFDEADIGRPKATAIAEKLAKINSNVRAVPFVVDVNHTNAEDLIIGCDIVLDGTDNMETRFLVNDACVKHGIPWVYGGAVGTSGTAMAIIPGKTPCFRCIVPEIPVAGKLPTCDTVGVLNTAPAMVAAIQSTSAIKLLTGAVLDSVIFTFDVWEHSFSTVKISRRAECICCAKGKFEFLSSERKDIVTQLCGSNAVQITPARLGKISLAELAGRLRELGDVKLGDIVLTFKVDMYELTIFTDARVIISGTSDEKVAKSLYAKYIGS